MRLYQCYEYRGGSRCMDCGYAANLNALEFDHVPERGPKMFEISAGVTRGWPTLQAELDKCDVVCANCYSIRTANRPRSATLVAT